MFFATWRVYHFQTRPVNGTFTGTSGTNKHRGFQVVLSIFHRRTHVDHRNRLSSPQFRVQLVPPPRISVSFNPFVEKTVFFLLVGGLEHFLFFYILGISSSQLTNSHFSRGVGQPPTRFFFLGQKMERFFPRSQAPSATWRFPALAGAVNPNFLWWITNWMWYKVGPPFTIAFSWGSHNSNFTMVNIPAGGKPR